MSLSYKGVGSAIRPLLVLRRGFVGLLGGTFTFAFVFVLDISKLAKCRMGTSRRRGRLSVLFARSLRSRLGDFRAVMSKARRRANKFTQLGALVGRRRGRGASALVLSNKSFSVKALVRAMCSARTTRLQVLKCLNYSIAALKGRRFSCNSSNLTSVLGTTIDSNRGLPEVIIYGIS